MYNYGNRLCNSTDNIFWHLGAGIGATYSDKIQPRALFGGGLSFGKTSKVMLTLGLAVGPSDKLSEAYNVKLDYATQPTNYIVNGLKAGYFFSVGYTL